MTQTLILYMNQKNTAFGLKTILFMKAETYLGLLSLPNSSSVR